MTKTLTIGVLVAAASGLAVQQHQHDPGEEHADHAMTEIPAPAMTVEDTGSELILTTTPVHLPVMEHGDDHGDGGHIGTFPPVETVTLPIHGYLRGFDYEVVDGDGNVLPQQIVHHFNVIDPDHKELFLPISQRLLAAGKETGRQAMPRVLMGVPVYAGQRLVVSTMLHNPIGKEFHDVSLRIKLAYTPVGRPWPLFEVYPFQLDVAFPAGDKSFDLPPGESSRSWEGQPSMEGRIMVLGSHFHEMATHITLEDVTTGEVLWTGYPITADDGEVTGVTIGHVYLKLGIKVRPDHTYRVTVFYNNESGETLVAGGMGVVGGVFLPSRGGAWPRVDPANPLYALDRQHYMREVRGVFETIVDGGGVVMEAAGDGHAGHD